MYTSGSTGTPKGVAIPHDGLINMLEGQRDLIRPTPGDRILQFASFGFDASVLELTWSLANGGRLVTAPREALRPGPDLARTLLTHRVTGAMLPPSALAVLGEDRFPELRVLQVAGEACPAELADTWSRGRRFHNVYGLTETSVWSVAAELGPEAGRPPIGAPMRNTSARVLDEDMQPVPTGVPGEIHLGGRAVGRCYLNRPALTAATFVPDPYGPPGSRTCRTGDLGTHRPDGALEWLGRRDTQVKLRGFRIELGEVEHALRALPEVRQAVVLHRTDLPGELALVAYLVLRDGTEASAGELARALRAGMPAYMVPARFVFLDEMPVNRSGKIDKRALPLPSAERAENGADYVAPATDAERLLAEVWREVLGLSLIGVHDDFFRIGGSSLSTVRVAALAAERGLPVSVRDLIERPTLAQLALRAEESAGKTGAVAAAVRSEVTLREGGGAPLWCVHPTGGSAAWFVPLARHLPPGRPVRAFQARGLLGGVDPGTVGGIAANYVAEIAGHGGRGPHDLLGWSMGANIALEMATQLHEAKPHRRAPGADRALPAQPGGARPARRSRPGHAPCAADTRPPPRPAAVARAREGGGRTHRTAAGRGDEPRRGRPGRQGADRGVALAAHRPGLLPGAPLPGPCPPRGRNPGRRAARRRAHARPRRRLPRLRGPLARGGPGRPDRPRHRGRPHVHARRAAGRGHRGPARHDRYGGPAMTPTATTTAASTAPATPAATTATTASGPAPAARFTERYLLDPAVNADPYGYLNALRDHAPVHWSPMHRAWLVTGHEQVMRCLRDPAVSADRVRPLMDAVPQGARDDAERAFAILSRWMVFNDPPQHR
ncbi:AMP-binding protein [Streptomyces radiopugnans]|nr:AMP-binding protein [Streptomyces radiopugnans]